MNIKSKSTTNINKDFNLDTSIFKAYDIRGIYPTQLNEETAYNIGLAFATYQIQLLNKTSIKIGVSTDMRLSGPSLKDNLIKGLLDAGADVYDLGLNSTPSFYFGVSYNNLDAGIQVSASHNPKQYNGFKMVGEKSKPISKATGLDVIKNIILENKYVSSNNKGSLHIIKDTTQTAIRTQLENYDLSKVKPLKVVIDGANSMGILDCLEIFKNIPQIQVVKVNFELDGNLPAHDADPLKPENLVQLQQEIIKNNADLGISPDGDGDRYFFVDEKGNIVRQEILRGIMAQIELKKDKDAVVCYDIRPGKITEDMIKELGGKYIVTKVGHSLIKQTMLQNNAVFGGESSGHYFYRTPFGTFEVPAILLAEFLLFISNKDLPLSQIIKPYQKYFNSGEINSKVSNINDKINEIKSKYTDGILNELDGITITYDDFWFNIRPSNTEPVLRLTLEAVSKEIMEQKTKEVLDLIRS